MAKNVFIFGAGASREAGGPLMLDFLDRAQDRRASSPEVAKAIELVFKAETGLRGAYAYANINLRNIEALWSTVQMAELLGECPGLTSSELSEIDRALRRLIVETLSDSLMPRYTGSDDAGLVFPYDEFRKTVLFDLNPYVLLTFNYDTALDCTMGTPPEVDREPKNAAPQPDRFLDIEGTKILKLHGSVHWVRCQNPNCSRIVQCGWNDAWSALRVGRKLSGRVCPGCGSLCGTEPIIVPPTWAKLDGQQQIREVWERAARELTGVRNLFIIGYSLPEGDRFFRDLFAISTIGAPLRRIWIIDPAAEAVAHRWKEFLGPAAVPYLKLHALKFSDAITSIRGVLKEDDQYG